MGVARRAGAALIALAVAIAAAPTAYAGVPVPTDNAFVIPGANSDSWAPDILEPLDPWATDGPLVPLISAHYYDCHGCTVTIIRYPRTAGPLFGPCAPFADESIVIGVGRVIDDLRDAEGPSVISGLSLGAMTADAAQRALDADPRRPPASDVTFIATADPSRVTPLTTGIGSFLPVGFRIPVLGWTVARPPSESAYDTVVVVGEYEWAADFPDRPWNLLADLNALVGFNYTHSEASLTDPADVPPPYLQPTDGLPKLVMPSAPAGITLRAKTTEPAAAQDNSTDQRPTSGSRRPGFRGRADTPRRHPQRGSNAVSRPARL